MKKIAVTGMTGFIGSNFANHTRIFKSDNIEIIDVKDEYFLNIDKLSKAVAGCDAIIHMAGASRSTKDDIYETNIGLTKKLIDALDSIGERPRIIFLSSVHESRGDSYGKSKKESRELLAKWSKNKSIFTGLVLPNVFGPSSKPFHNSAIATFCHQLVSKKRPSIDEDRIMGLLYVENLINIIYKVLLQTKPKLRIDVKPDVSIKVSRVLEKLQSYKEEYLDNNIIPSLQAPFDVNLFNTFCSFIPDEQRVKYLEIHKDDRGYLCEALKTNTKGQVFYSKTNKGIVRGNHFHTRKIERFCVLEGRAEIAIRRIGSKEVIKYKLSGKNPAVIDMPIWYSHNIKNLTDKVLVTMFWTNEIFNPKDQDTFYEQVKI